jgi:large subunit ribosomal protein L49
MLIISAARLTTIRVLRVHAQRALQTAASPASVPAHTTKLNLPYYVPRNSRGSLPVYTDIRNGGTRRLVLIRNVQGNVQVRTISGTLATTQLIA